MTYDCFTFFNELDLLEIRLNVLNDVVDRFVLVEATKTFSGHNKPLYFNQNRDRFKDFLPKIVHVIVDDYPRFVTAWTYESHQRNCIIRGLADPKPDDVILISDLDEIPNPVLVEQYRNTPGIKLFHQAMYYYYFNYLCHTTPIWRCGTKMLFYKDFLTFDERYKVAYSEYLPEENNHGVTINKVRHLYGADVVVPNGGWHFSYLGKVDSIVEKLKSFSHQELNVGNNFDASVVADRICKGRDPFGGNARFYGVALDNRFPQYLLDNKTKYSHLIFNVTPRYIRATWVARKYFLLREKCFRYIVFELIPQRFHPLLLRLRKAYQKHKLHSA